MYLYEELLDLAMRIAFVVKNNPNEKIGINMGLLGRIDMEGLKDWVEMIERKIK